MRLQWILIVGLMAAPLHGFAETLATVNGVPVTREVVNTELKSNPAFANQPGAEKVALEKMIAGELLVQEARKQKLDRSREVKQELENVTRKILANAAVNRYLSEHPVSEEEIQARYDGFIKNNPIQYHIRHIMVKTEAEAKDIRNAIKNSNDFAEQAKQHSIDTESGKQGGDLGWFIPDQAAKSLADTFSKMEKGEISQPVQTQNGWHLVELVESQPSKLPSLQQTREAIAKELASKRIEKFVGELHKKAKISRP
ncbi:MAG: peptidylprolyl isomerase [Sulfurimicrobium sp.]|nr:peptidylprolyl isomerase [Sulfurimicrobium sp.]MDP1705896.1 peptidylprolyl isomerase [Sulfurimicrobium sp.]MDP2199706.1 peptidylprolyl isomerase [Sulfurimicrobium sp.]